MACDMSLSIVGFNVNGLCSSEPYVYQLTEQYDIVCLSEHWLSGPELFKLNQITGSSHTVSKCSDSLTD